MQIDGRRAKPPMPQQVRELVKHHTASKALHREPMPQRVPSDISRNPRRPHHLLQQITQHAVAQRPEPPRHQARPTPHNRLTTPVAPQPITRQGHGQGLRHTARSNGPPANAALPVRDPKLPPGQVHSSKVPDLPTSKPRVRSQQKPQLKLRSPRSHSPKQKLQLLLSNRPPTRADVSLSSVITPTTSSIRHHHTSDVLCIIQAKKETVKPKLRPAQASGDRRSGNGRIALPPRLSLARSIPPHLPTYTVTLRPPREPRA